MKLVLLSAACLCFLLVLLAPTSQGQNQVPPGLRMPPFIVVPPVGERVPRPGPVASNRRDVGEPDEGISDLMVPEKQQPPVRGPELANPPFVRGPEPANPPFVRGPEPANPPFVRGPEPPNPPPVRGPEPPNQPPVRGPQEPPMVKNPSGQFVPHPDGGRPFGQRPPPPPPSAMPEKDAPPRNLPPIDQKCFQCMCMAASGCDTSIKCVAPDANAYFCGQYHISWSYWADSGKPEDNPEDPHAWEDCTLDKQCSERSIQGYMNKFANDCNNDGRIDCIDYARIHKAGPPPSCNQTWVDNTAYWKRFVECWGGALDLRTNRANN